MKSDKTKVTKTSPLSGAKGGKNKMLGKSGAGVSKPHVAAGKSSSSGKFASGGKGKMAGKSSSKTATPV